MRNPENGLRVGILNITDILQQFAYHQVNRDEGGHPSPNRDEAQKSRREQQDRFGTRDLYQPGCPLSGLRPVLLLEHRSFGHARISSVRSFQSQPLLTLVNFSTVIRVMSRSL